MEARLVSLYKNEKTHTQYTIIEKFKGSTLKGKKYKPLFNYYAHVTYYLLI